MIDGGPRRVFTAISSLMTSSASFSFTSMSLGDALTGRLIVVGVQMATSGTNFDINSVSVGGNAASGVVTRAQTDTLNKCRTALWQVSLATGTSATIDVVFAGSVSGCQIGVWAIYDLASHTATDTAEDGANDGNTASASIDISGSGILLVSTLITGGSGTQTLSGVDTVDASQNTTQRQWGSYQASSAETGRSLSFSGSGGADSARALVAASWA